MTKKYLTISLDDEKAEYLASVLTSKTAKKILNYLSEKESSEGDIAKELKLPANTVHYNIKKLVAAGLIHPSRNFFWSVKGKKIFVYALSNKHIVISPTSSVGRGFLSALGVTALGALLIKRFVPNTFFSPMSSDSITRSSGEVAVESAAVVQELVPPIVEKTSPLIQTVPDVWLWFLLGGIVALLAYLLFQWRRL